MNRACQTRILKRAEERRESLLLRCSTLCENLGRFDTADPIGNSGERMLVYRRIIGTSKTGAELLLLLRFAIRGEGVLSEIKRVVNIPGYNNNLVQNEEFSPHLGKPSPTFPSRVLRALFDGKSREEIFANDRCD